MTNSKDRGQSQYNGRRGVWEEKTRDENQHGTNIRRGEGDCFRESFGGAETRCGDASTSGSSIDSNDGDRKNLWGKEENRIWRYQPGDIGILPDGDGSVGGLYWDLDQGTRPNTRSYTESETDTAKCPGRNKQLGKYREIQYTCTYARAAGSRSRERQEGKAGYGPS